MSLFDLILVMVLLYWLGGYWRKRMEQDINKQIEDLETYVAEMKKIYKRVIIEQHGDWLYVYEHETDKFLCQGQTAQDFQDRIPNDMIFGIVGGDAEAVRRFKELFPKQNTE